MTNDHQQLPHTPAGTAVAALTVAVAAAGILAWIWLADWRVGATAGVVVAVLCFVGAGVDSPAKRRAHADGYCGACGRELPVRRAPTSEPPP